LKKNYKGRSLIEKGVVVLLSSSRLSKKEAATARTEPAVFSEEGSRKEAAFVCWRALYRTGSGS